MRASPRSLESGRRSVTDSPTYCSTSDYCFLTLTKQSLLPRCRVRPRGRRRRRRWPNALARSPARPASRPGSRSAANMACTQQQSCHGCSRTVGRTDERREQRTVNDYCKVVVQGNGSSFRCYFTDLSMIFSGYDDLLML
jgi:hypothetical protein